MDYNQIIALLNKHFEGKATRKEELFYKIFILKIKI
mgnify:CR=1 FL=1